MHITKSAVLLILGFSTAALANIYPDADPCNPAPPLDGEYQGEYDIRQRVDQNRCACNPPPPAQGETRAEFEERNRIDRDRCRTPIVVPSWFDPGPVITLGPLVGPAIIVGGVSWREPGHWRDPRWARGREGPREGPRIEPGRGRPEPARPEPVRGRPEPRPEPGRPAGHIEPGRPAGHVEPGRPAGHVEPGRPAGHVEPARPAPHPQPAKGRPGHA